MIKPKYSKILLTCVLIISANSSYAHKINIRITNHSGSLCNMTYESTISHIFARTPDYLKYIDPTILNDASSIPDNEYRYLSIISPNTFEVDVWYRCGGKGFGFAAHSGNGKIKKLPTSYPLEKRGGAGKNIGFR